ncbi:MAG: aminotransferase class III-fold pyridoxal phosphate-dependent enzyme [Gaiellaceae bacterium]
MTSVAPAPLDLQKAARDHLWLHFTRMSAYEGSEVPIIVRGDGCYLEDSHGKRYLDALAGLFSVNIGYGYGEEMGEAAAAQMRELPFYTNWSYAHPRAIELANEVASLTPGDLNRLFFVSGGSEAVESAWKLARQYYSARGEQRVRAAIAPSGETQVRVDEAQAIRSERRWKAISRNIAYHGTTMGALSINGIAALRAPFEPLVPDVIHVRNTNRYHRPPDETPAQFTSFLLDDLEEAILQAGPETVAMVIMEPVQNAGGCFTPPTDDYWPGVRAICDKYGILLCADEVICGFGRLGDWFGTDRFGVRPDLVTFAKGVTSGYLPVGGVLASGRVAEPFWTERGRVTVRHGQTYAGHASACAAALANLDILEREGLIARGAELEGELVETLAPLADHPLVGEVRGGTGLLAAVAFDPELLAEDAALPGKAAVAVRRHGLVMRALGRELAISPPLIVTGEEIGLIADGIEAALDDLVETGAVALPQTAQRS